MPAALLPASRCLACELGSCSENSDLAYVRLSFDSVNREPHRKTEWVSSPVAVICHVFPYTFQRGKEARFHPEHRPRHRLAAKTRPAPTQLTERLPSCLSPRPLPSNTLSSSKSSLMPEWPRSALQPSSQRSSRCSSIG